jgi:type 2 lantibiotic biosynthesis protein LanM
LAIYEGLKKMESSAVTTSQTATTIWQKPGWYHASTLADRITLLRASASDQFLNPPNYEKAQRKLHQWQGQNPFHKGSFFVDRLATDDITEAELLTILAEPVEMRQAFQSASPEWLQELREAFEGEVAATAFLLPDDESKPASPFLHSLQPLFARGVKRLLVGIDELSQHYTHMPFNPDTIVPCLVANVARQMLSKVDRTFVLELQVARSRGRLRGATAQERFQNFIAQLGQDDKILNLLEEYCVLAQQVVATIDQWASYSLEFLRHLCADWEYICAVFTPGDFPGTLVELQGGAGDSHRGGRSVMLLKFSSGFQLVYKPKSLAIDVHFQELLLWLNDHGYQPQFRTLTLLNKGSYGWSEFIAARECTSEEEAVRFYERQGGYLALLYVLEAMDFHAENIIATGEYPMLIDLEALFHPRTGEHDALNEHPAYEAIHHSVLRIGLLPQRIFAYGDVDGIDMSGLGGRGGQLSPRGVPQWAGAGTDQMRLVYERVEIAATHNQPKLNGQDIEAVVYRDCITAAFSRMYRLLVKHREEIVKELLPRFASDEIRFLARPTEIYARFLYESFHPDMLRDALVRERHFDRLWVGIEWQLSISRLIPAERADLLARDMPLFTTYPDCRDLFSSRGKRIANFFHETGLAAVQKRLQMLDEQDLAMQSWIIQASFACMLMGSDANIRKAGLLLPLSPSRSGVTRKRLIQGARAVGDYLDKSALWSKDAAGWLGVTQVKGAEWAPLPAGTDMYSGAAGITLFLAYLTVLTGESRYRELTEAALKSVQYLLKRHQNYQDADGIGAFGGLGSPIYLFSHLGRLWNQPELIHEAEALVALLPPMIEKDDHLDIIAGSAGCIASLLSLYAVAPPERILTAAIQCGDHLIAHAQPMHEGIGWYTLPQQTALAGFAHGGAGIALSLLRLATISGEERFRQTACAALAYERSLFSPERQNWLDLRSTRGSIRSTQVEREVRQHFMVAWCHGAAGIGLARLASLQHIDDAMLCEEIDAALKTTVAAGFGGEHSLCHGDSGNLETLLVASEVLAIPQYRQPLANLTARLLDSIDRYGWLTDVPLDVKTPGLMVGITGIGYALLRLAEPDTIPSVLSLAPPKLLR